MEKIIVEVKNENLRYPIILGAAILPKIADFIKEKHKNKRIAVITDDNMKSAYEGKIMGALKSLNPYILSVPPGEDSKSRKTKQEIEDILLEKKYGRDTLLIAFGGGIIGDLAGFVASTFNRGVPLLHIPTTLLAMVDSSIGGKTGINTKHGKNLIGTIYQPEAVFTDLNFLETLPDNEFLNGLAEIIKMAAALDKQLFSYIEKNHKKILSRDKDVLHHLIRRSIELKKDIVEKDPHESGPRQVFNFGHTIGHAVEADSGFSVKHGFCISIGMAVESRISVLSENLKADEEKRIINLLKSVGLPTKISKGAKTENLVRFMLSDKKTRSQKPRFVILSEIGSIKCQKFSIQSMTGGLRANQFQHNRKISEHAQEPPTVKPSSNIPPVCDWRFLTKENNLFSFEIEESIVKKAIEESRE